MRLFSASLLLLALVASYPAHAQDGEPILLGHKHTLHSAALNESREYWVSLPESYDQAAHTHKNYPLLIVLDGRAHFKSIAGMVHYMSAGVNNNRRIPEMIVVAIQNVNRERDFTPDKVITTRQNDTGGGDTFLTFVEKELIPTLDTTYRTRPYRILAGHSLGGLLATHAYMKPRTLFNAFLAIDPSFGTWDERTMDAKLEAVTSASFARYLYMASANWGKRNFNNRDRHLRLYEGLHRKAPKAFQAHLDYFEDENHGSVPLIAFHQGLSSIFAGYGLSYRDVDSPEHVSQHFQTLSQRLSYDFQPPEELIDRLGARSLRSQDEKQKRQAIAFLRLNTQNYPTSVRALERLGQAYAILGDIDQAIAQYEQALAIDPQNEDIRSKITDLRASN